MLIYSCCFFVPVVFLFLFISIRVPVWEKVVNMESKVKQQRLDRRQKKIGRGNDRIRVVDAPWRTTIHKDGRVRTETVCDELRNSPKAKIKALGTTGPTKTDKQAWLKYSTQSTRQWRRLCWFWIAKPWRAITDQHCHILEALCSPMPISATKKPIFRRHHTR